LSGLLPHDETAAKPDLLTFWGIQEIELVGPAHSKTEVELSKAWRWLRIAGGQDELLFEVSAKQLSTAVNCSGFT
jgi:hypothetical protein